MIFGMNKKKISKNNIYISSLAMGFIIFSLLVLTNVYATHISEPILTLDKDSKYNMNETISVSGWVKYNDKPDSNVLVLLKLLSLNGNEVFQDQVRSNSNGNFTSNVALLGSNVTEVGTFTLYAESQCRDEHRNICNHNNSLQTLVVIN
jgi:hypothetical protein